MSWTPEPWAESEHQMREAGHDLDKIPRSIHHQHIWADGLLFFWHRHRRLPTAEELAEDMFDEWDDPVSLQSAEQVLGFLTS